MSIAQALILLGIEVADKISRENICTNLVVQDFSSRICSLPEVQAACIASNVQLVDKF